MTMVTHPPPPARRVATPNVLTDARIVAARLVLPTDAGRERHDPGSIASGRPGDSMPGDPGLRLTRISRRAAGQRTGHPARKMEDDGPARRDRIPHRGQSRRPDRADHDHDGLEPVVDLGAGHALYRMGLFPGRRAAPDR